MKNELSSNNDSKKTLYDGIKISKRGTDTAVLALSLILLVLLMIALIKAIG